MDQPQQRVLYVAAWTDGTHGAGGDGGVHVFAMADDGDLEPLGRVPETTMNSGYLAESSDGRTLYALDERKDIVGGTGGGWISRYDVDPADPIPRHIERTSTIGPNPSYVALHPGGRLLVTANHGNTYHAAVKVAVDPDAPGGYRRHLEYDDGTVGVIGIDDAGAFEPARAVVLPMGHGPDPQHQRSSHPHSAAFDPTGEFAIVCDKGTDTISTFRVHAEERRFDLLQRITCRPRSAPRHPLFHPIHRVLYVLNELESSIDLYSYDETFTLEHDQNVASTGRSTHPDNHPSDLCIHPSGRVLFAANRGENTVASFLIEPESGRLTPQDEMAVGGARPRAIAVSPDGRFLYAANPDSNNVTRIAVDGASGALGSAVEVARMTRPTRILFSVRSATAVRR